MTATFVITGPPRTKKTSQRIVTIRAKGGRSFTKILPSLAHEKWFANAMTQAPIIKQLLRASGLEFPIMRPVNIAAKFYRERASGDLSGFMQALADFLQEPVVCMKVGSKLFGKTTRKGAGIILNDAQVVGWNGSELCKDAVHPRIEVQLTIL